MNTCTMWSKQSNRSILLIPYCTAVEEWKSIDRPLFIEKPGSVEFTEMRLAGPGAGDDPLKPYS